MSSASDTIRFMGASHRETIARIYMTHPSDFGFKVVRRFVGEGARHVAEVHGDRVAFEMLANVSDKLIDGKLLDLDFDDEFSPAFVDWLEGDAAAQEAIASDAAFDALSPEEHATNCRAMAADYDAQARAKWPRWRQLAWKWAPSPMVVAVWTFLIGYALGAGK